jgi:hypothetical protein
MALEFLQDPATGKIKTPVLIAGGGIVLFGVFMLMGRGSNSGGSVIGEGQSSGLSGMLGDLSDALDNLNNAGGGGSSGGGGGSVPGSAGRVVTRPTHWATIATFGQKTSRYSGGTTPVIDKTRTHFTSGIAPKTISRYSGTYLANPTDSSTSPKLAYKSNTAPANLIIKTTLR